jgi:hypothetical protein
MNDDAKEVLKVGAEAALKPFADLITKLFGGPAEQIGGMWTDGLAARRQIRGIKLMQKVRRAIDEAGFEPKTIPDKIWVPLLQEAVLEDDDELQTLWANLIANAADPRSGVVFRESLGNALRQLTSADVRFLDQLYDLSIGVDAGRIYLFQEGTDLCGYGVLLEVFHRATVGELTSVDQLVGSRDAFEGTLDTMVRSAIFRRQTQVMQGHGYSDPIPHDAEMLTKERYLFTPFGYELVRACRPPKK